MSVRSSRISSLWALMLMGAFLFACGDAKYQRNTGENPSDLNLITYGANGYPYCTNGSNTGGGYGWDPRVTDPRGSHSCLVAPTGPNGYPYCTNGSNTGGGYGWDPDVTDPRGSHSCLVPVSPAPVPISPGVLPTLNLGVAGNASFKLSSYGDTLRRNKEALVAAISAAGGNAQEKAVIIAIAMQETTLMSLNQRDASKDRTPSANVSILNLNYDMLTKLGYTGGDYGASLNDPTKLTQVVGYLLKGFRTWGFQSTLNYVRGGSTAFRDGVSYGAATYRNAILTIYNQIAKDQSLQKDDRRVEVNVPWV